ncbi:hypothetical protein JCM8547_005647 [Rhodosporidiobolus lusitaniae]
MARLFTALLALLLLFSLSSAALHAKLDWDYGSTHSNTGWLAKRGLDGHAGLEWDYGSVSGTSRMVKRSSSCYPRSYPAKEYSSLVAFGASYTDNAHPRSAANKGSLRFYWPYEQWGGRYTNGQVAVEWMVNSTASPVLGKNVSLIDYAYGGSMIENGLAGTNASWPDAEEQIATYLFDLKAGNASVGNGRVLHYFNSGINPVTSIWLTTLYHDNLTDSVVAKAKEGVTQNVQAMAKAIESISKSKAVKSLHDADYLIVGIPPLEIVPTIANQIPSSHNTTSGRLEALKLMKTLSAQFNSELAAFAPSFSKEKDVKKRGSRVWFYDFAELWYDMNENPGKYGILDPLKTCYNSTTGGVCTNPEEYLYFDTLHPVTSVHQLMAEKMNALVLGA